MDVMFDAFLFVTCDLQVETPTRFELIYKFGGFIEVPHI